MPTGDNLRTAVQSSLALQSDHPRPPILNGIRNVGPKFEYTLKSLSAPQSECAGSPEFREAEFLATVCHLSIVSREHYKRPSQPLSDTIRYQG